MSERSKKPRKTQGQCIFCGRTGLSKEHIWSDWLKDIIPRNDEHGEYWGRMHRDGGSIDGVWIEPPRGFARQGSVLQRKVRNVCQRYCNNGWMSRVVDRAKPHVERMILGKTFQMSRKDQADVAAWIGITTVMQEFANRNGARRIPHEDRSVLMNTEAPPLTWSIWAAGYRGMWWAPMGHYHIPMSYSKRSTGDALASPGGELQLTTFTLGELLVHVFTSTQSEMIDAYRSYIGGASNSGKLHQLWPVVGDALTWPPSTPLGDAEVDSVAFDWVEQNWGARGMPGRPEERDVCRLATWLAFAIQGGLISTTGSTANVP